MHRRGGSIRYIRGWRRFGANDGEAVRQIMGDSDTSNAGCQEGTQRGLLAPTVSGSTGWPPVQSPPRIKVQITAPGWTFLVEMFGSQPAGVETLLPADNPSH